MTDIISVQQYRSDTRKHARRTIVGHAHCPAPTRQDELDKACRAYKPESSCPEIPTAVHDEVSIDDLDDVRKSGSSSPQNVSDERILGREPATRSQTRIKDSLMYCISDY